MPSLTHVRSQSQPAKTVCYRSLWVCDLPLNRAQVPIQPPDMGQTVAEFSRGLLALVTALFNLQAAVINYYSRANQKGLVEAFQQSLDALLADSGKYVIFFKGCRAYAVDYMTLCEYSMTHRSSETLPLASGLLDMARDQLSEIRMLRSIHSKAYAELDKQIQTLPSEFRKRQNSQTPPGL